MPREISKIEAESITWEIEPVGFAVNDPLWKMGPFASIREDMTRQEVERVLGAPIQKHTSAEGSTFDIEIDEELEFWEYRQGSPHIEAIWLVEFEEELVSDLGRSQGVVLSEIEFDYLQD
ncbi:MAG: hypothetical protein ACYTG7_20345 [Planctomycetota bacterium]